jgi:hypothetical protein
MLSSTLRWIVAVSIVVVAGWFSRALAEDAPPAPAKVSAQELRVLRESSWSCAPSRTHALVIFDGAGLPLCKPPRIAETATIDVIVIAPSRLFETPAPDRTATEAGPGVQAKVPQEPYTIEIVPGEAIESRIHGDYSAIKNQISTLMAKALTKVCKGVAIPDGYSCVVESHKPISAKDVAIKVTSKPLEIDRSVTIPIAQTYALGIGALAAVTTANRVTYGVTDKLITESTDKHPVSYYVTLELPLFWPWERRYYDYGFATFSDRFSVIGGLGIPDPRESLALGLSFRALDGVAIALVWMPHKKERLAEGAVGDMIEGDKVSTDKVWSFDTFGIGIAIDSGLVTRITGAPK